MTNDTQSGEVERLLPCPFCGGEAERIDIEDGENAGGSCICCTRCLASSNIEFEFKENFVSNWNSRTSAEIRRLRDALKEIVDVIRNIPEYIRKDSFAIQNLYVGNRRGDIAVMALAEQSQPTGRTDSERLDWLMRHTHYGIPGFDPVVSGRDPEQRMADLLRAIDAAMDSEKGGE